MTPATSTGTEKSHESLCVLNETATDIRVELTAYFEDRGPSRSVPFNVPASRCLHLRLGDPDRIGGLRIPTGVPYGLVVGADGPLHVQYSRLDTTQAAYALMSVLPVPGAA